MWSANLALALLAFGTNAAPNPDRFASPLDFKRFQRTVDSIGGDFLEGRSLDGIGGSNLIGRSLDGIGGSNLIGRSLDGIGGSNLIGRSLDSIGGEVLAGRSLDGIGGSNLIGRSLDGIGGSNLIGRSLDGIGGSNLIGRSLDGIGGDFLVRRALDGIGNENLMGRSLDGIGGGNLVGREVSGFWNNLGGHLVGRQSDGSWRDNGYWRYINKNAYDETEGMIVRKPTTRSFGAFQLGGGYGVAKRAKMEKHRRGPLNGLIPGGAFGRAARSNCFRCQSLVYDEIGKLTKTPMQPESDKNGMKAHEDLPNVDVNTLNQNKQALDVE